MRSSSADKTPPITRVRRRCRPACPKQAMRMPGPLTLAGDATEPLHAVTKQQLEAAQKSAIPADGSVTEPKIADFAVSIRTLEDEGSRQRKSYSGRCSPIIWQMARSGMKNWVIEPSGQTTWPTHR